MRTFIILASFLALAVTQDGVPQWWLDIQHGLGVNGPNVIDTIHNFRIEYHPDAPKGDHLLIAISDRKDSRECHFIEVDSSWESLLNDTSKKQAISEEVYKLVIADDTKETDLTIQQLQAAYGDSDSSRECWKHNITVMSYTPSAAILAMPRLH